MNFMKRPSKSPDLNPIENAWAMLKKKLLARSTYPTNAVDFFDVLQTE